jgi:hypothetical protein
MNNKNLHDKNNNNISHTENKKSEIIIKKREKITKTIKDSSKINSVTVNKSLLLPIYINERNKKVYVFRHKNQKFSLNDI